MFSQAVVATTLSFLGQSQWLVSLHGYPKYYTIFSQMKSFMKQSPQWRGFTLTFPRLSKAFNWYKLLGSFVPKIRRGAGECGGRTAEADARDPVNETNRPQRGFHSVTEDLETTLTSFTRMKLFPSLSSPFHANNHFLFSLTPIKCAWHTSETPIVTGLIEQFRENRQLVNWLFFLLEKDAP